MKRQGSAIVCVSMMIALSGCASTTLMESRPAGADVTVDDEYYVGETPVQVRELPRSGTVRTYTFSKQGYQPQVIELEAESSSRNMWACICSLGMLWPALLFGEMPSGIVVDMEREQKVPRAEFSRTPKVQFGH